MAIKWGTGEEREVKLRAVGRKRRPFISSQSRSFRLRGKIQAKERAWGSTSNLRSRRRKGGG